MNLKIAHILDLKGLCFNIPDYQRGYRWEVKQVRALLDDLYEFKGSGHAEGEFYCLQPLVVVKNEDLSTDELTVFDVVDGQQRLTTIYLILNYIDNEDGCPFRIRYARAAKDRMRFEDGELVYERLRLLTSDMKRVVPDYFYLTEAMDDIRNWFAEKKKVVSKPKSILLKVLACEEYMYPEKVFYEQVDDMNKNLNDVRFIWYDASAGSDMQIGKVESIDIFKRLNYGKTSLTAAELIKALLFQCDLYGVDLRPVMEQVTFRMSTEWDEMEKQLQDPFMWAMLTGKRVDSPSHIDFVLSFVAQRLANEMEYKGNVDDKDYDYLVFSEYLERKAKDKVLHREVVECLWRRIQDAYAVFRSWFEDHELYHLVGLFMILCQRQGVKLLYDKYMESNRTDFITWVKSKIGNEIKVIGTVGDDKPKTLVDLQYGEDSFLINKILLVFNVDLYIKNSQDKRRFPFAYYAKTIPSLEHIHPQSLDDMDLGFDDLCKWYLQKRKALGGKKVAEVKFLDKFLLDPTPKKKKMYDNGKKECLGKLKEIERFFDDKAGMDSCALHGISNLALVDKGTNSALGNMFMSGKREKLRELSQQYEQSGGEYGAYVYMGTWKVFNKEYSHGIANMEYWMEEDRKNYYRQIENTYDEYTK